MITRREQEMLDLQDAGLRVDQIAERMGVKEDTVRRTLSALSNAPTGAFEYAARLGSDMLLQAIRTHHPEQLLMRPGVRR
jgi:predicted ArsR family transcriptional regulator